MSNNNDLQHKGMECEVCGCNNASIKLQDIAYELWVCQDCNTALFWHYHGMEQTPEELMTVEQRNYKQKRQQFKKGIDNEPQL